MPRQPRLDAPGLLQHVMARGIERRKIFKDDKDRNSFLDRLADILEETQTQCYAWALIPNHFHILLRTGPTPLSKIMRRFMTGYAVTFNKRHKRSGYLFQNRYKSIVCEEDPYLLELIRYIHLNPLRARLVQDLKELDKYLWTGHSSLLGKRKSPLIPSQPKKLNQPNNAEKSLAEKTIEDVLLYFGNTKTVARRRYRQFVKNGIDQGKRPELQGGGLVRSAGGNKSGLLGRKKEEREKGDARILGSGNFVTEALACAAEEWEDRRDKEIPVSELIEKVAFSLNMRPEVICSSSRKRKIAAARALVCHFAINNLAYSASEVARSLSISRVNAGRCAERGKKVLDNYEDLKNIVQ